MMTGRKILAVGEVALSMLIMGSSIIASKLITQAFPTAFASEVRLVLSACMQFSMLHFTGASKAKPTRRDWGILFLQALLGVFLYSYLFLEGLRRTTALESSILSSFIPAAGALIAVLVFRERLGGKGVLGVVLTVAGTIAVNLATGGSSTLEASQKLTGNLMILGSAFCQAIFITFGKLVSVRVHPFMIGGVVSSIGALLFLPFCIDNLQSFHPECVPLTAWLLILYYGVVCSGLGVMMMNHGSRVLAPSVVSALSALNPVGGLVLSCMLLHETFELWHMAGILIIGAGIVLVARAKEQPVPGVER